MTPAPWSTRSTGAAPGSGTRSATRRPRLTPRGRVFVLLLVSALLLMAFSLGRVSTSAETTAAKVPIAQTVVVPGDTLWSIAARVAPANDPRETVAQLVRLNHLPGVGVAVGQRLLLPSPG